MKWKNYRNVFVEPMIAAMTGFGFYWLYFLAGINVWVSMIVGLYVAALVSRYIINGAK